MGNDTCEYFLANREKDSKIYFLSGILCCANTNCPYNNQIGSAFKFGGEGLPARFCKTNGLISENPLLFDERIRVGELELLAEVVETAQS